MKVEEIKEKGFHKVYKRVKELNQQARDEGFDMTEFDKTNELSQAFQWSDTKEHGLRKVPGIEEHFWTLINKGQFYTAFYLYPEYKE